MTKHADEDLQKRDCECFQTPESFYTITGEHQLYYFLTDSVNSGPSNTYVVVVVLLYALVQNRSKTPTLAVKMRNAFSD